MTTPLRYAPHIFLALAIVTLAAAPARAQVETPMRASHGLLGANDPSSKAPKTLEVDVSLFGAYDDDLTADPLTAGVSTAVPAGATSAGGLSGVYSGLNAGLTFNRNGQHIGFGATGSTNYRYDTSARSFETVSDQAGATISVRGRHDTLQFGGSGGYRPYFSFAPFVPSIPDDSGQQTPPLVDATVSKQSALSLGGSMSFEHRLGARTTLSVSGALSQTHFSDNSFKQNEKSVGGVIRHNLTKGVALRVGFTEHVLSSTDARAVRTTTHLHDLDLGIDYSKSLGLTRKTTMGFTTGSSAVDQGAGMLYQATGSAWLRRELGQTWAAQGTFTRGVGLRAGFSQPDLSNALSVTFGGQVSHRLDFRSSGAYTKGAVGLTSPNGYGSYNTSARLRLAFTSLLSAYVEHVAYWYKFDRAADLPGTLAPRVLRQGVRAGISLSAPLFR